MNILIQSVDSQLGLVYLLVGYDTYNSRLNPMKNLTADVKIVNFQKLVYL